MDTCGHHRCPPCASIFFVIAGKQPVWNMRDNITTHTTNFNSSLSAAVDARTGIPLSIA